MQAQEFAKFVASQQPSSNEAEVDWAAMRDEWLMKLDDLYSQIREFLKDFIADGSIHCSFTEVVLNEENIGIYSAKRMNIRIGRQHVYLEPIGTLLIGFAGRVDVVGSAGRRAQLVLVNQDARSAVGMVKVTVGVEGSMPAAPPPSTGSISWIWKIMAHDARRTFVELDKDSFFELLMEIAGA